MCANLCINHWQLKTCVLVINLLSAALIMPKKLFTAVLYASMPVNAGFVICIKSVSMQYMDYKQLSQILSGQAWYNSQI